MSVHQCPLYSSLDTWPSLAPQIFSLAGGLHMSDPVYLIPASTTGCLVPISFDYKFTCNQISLWAICSSASAPIYFLARLITRPSRMMHYGQVPWEILLLCSIIINHDEVMETFSALMALSEVNPVTSGFPPKAAGNAELQCFLCCCAEQAVQQTVKLSVI